MPRVTMTRGDARKLLDKAGVDWRGDFHALRSSEVDKVLAVAKLYGYRRSRNAPGSKARMFFYMLQRMR